MTFPDALKELARRYQIDLPESNLSDAERERIRQREQLYKVNAEAARIFHETLISSKQAEGARNYLHERGVPLDAVQKYQLGYAPAPESAGWQFLISRLQQKKYPIALIEQAGLAVRKDQGRYYDRFRGRVLFPIYDMSGREVAFGGRILGQGKPKYMNSPESMVFTKSSLLFGLYQHRKVIRSARRAIVVEGNFDLLLLAIHGIDNVVAPLGTALTQEHIKALGRYCDEVVLLFDGDSAGLRAARRSIPFFLSEQLEGRVALLPEGHDPDTLVREKGATAVRQLIEKAEPLAEFVFSALQEEHGVTLSGKNRIVTELADLMSHATDAGQRELMAAHFSEQLGVSADRFLVEQKSASPINHITYPHVSTEVDPVMPSGSDWDSPELSVYREEEYIEEDWDGYSTFGSEVGDASLYSLPKKQRQLLDFLLLYPEFFSDLLASGLKETLDGSPLMRLVEAMERVAVAGTFIPEQLFSVISSGSDREYVAEVLGRDGEYLGIDSEGQARSLCGELFTWLKETGWQREVEVLQRQILAAEQEGNYELVSELQRKCLCCKGKKNTENGN